MDVESAFKQQLLDLKNSDKKSVLLTKEEYFNLVEELKEALKESSSKTGRQYYILSRLNDLTYNDVIYMYWLIINLFYMYVYISHVSSIVNGVTSSSSKTDNKSA